LNAIAWWQGKGKEKGLEKKDWEKEKNENLI